LALDCERILTKKGERLARVSIVNYYGNIVFDTLVKPWAKVYDYREWITGIKPLDLKHAPSYPKMAPIVRIFISNFLAQEDPRPEDSCGSLP
jgi:RNA exonuclease 4